MGTLQIIQRGNQNKETMVLNNDLPISINLQTEDDHIDKLSDCKQYEQSIVYLDTD